MPQLFYALIAVLSLGVVAFKKLVKKEDKGMEIKYSGDDRLKAHVHIVSNDFIVDGRAIDDLSFKNLRDEQSIVHLWAGPHTFDCVFETMDVKRSGTVQLKTRRVKFTLDVKAGNVYTLGLYTFNAEKRRKYYKDSVGEEILEIPVNVIGRDEECYVICYKLN